MMNIKQNLKKNHDGKVNWVGNKNNSQTQINKFVRC